MNRFWDERFAAEDYIYGTEPNAYLAAQAALLTPGMTALVPADGEGRNGVWLAGQGLAVTSVDSSPVGLAKAARLAAARGLAVTRVEADLAGWDWPVAAFDLCAAIFIHFEEPLRRRIHAGMAAALKPGGFLVMEVFGRDQLSFSSGGPRDAALLYDADGLARDFRGLEILDLTAATVDLAEGRFHRGPAATVRLTARKRA